MESNAELARGIDTPCVQRTVAADGCRVLTPGRNNLDAALWKHFGVHALKFSDGVLLLPRDARQ